MRSRLRLASALALLVSCTHAVPNRERPDEPIGAEEEASVWATAPLDDSRTERLRQALEDAKTFGPSLRPRYAATMLANAERDRVLRPLVDALNLVQQSGVENAPLVLVQPFEKYSVADAWKRSCDRGVKAIADIVVLPPEERAEVLYASCKLERSGLITKEEARTADASALAMATLIHDRLKSGGALRAEELEALRMLVIGSLEAFHDIAPPAEPSTGGAGGGEPNGDSAPQPLPVGAPSVDGSPPPMPKGSADAGGVPSTKRGPTPPPQSSATPRSKQ